MANAKFQASCGCGFFVTNQHPFATTRGKFVKQPNAEDAFLAICEHADITGHKCEMRGTVEEESHGTAKTPER